MIPQTVKAISWGAGGAAFGALTGLGDDDYTQYALLLGRSGGQTLIGGTASGDDLTLIPTSNATQGCLILGADSDNGAIIVAPNYAALGDLAAGAWMQNSQAKSLFLLSAGSSGPVGLGILVGSTYREAVSVTGIGSPVLKLMPTHGVVGIGMGSSTPARQLEVRSTSAQIRGSYDGSNYFELASSSGGDLTVSASGGDVHIGSSTTFTVDTTNTRVGIGGAATANQLLTLTYAPTTSAAHKAFKINHSPAYSTGGTVSAVQRALEVVNTITGTDTVTGNLQGLYGLVTVNKTGGSASAAYGSNGIVAQAGSVDIATIVGTSGQYWLTWTANVTTNAVGLFAPAPSITGSGLVTGNSIGVLVGNYGHANVTTAYGIYVNAQTDAATNYGIIVAGASTINYLQGSTPFGQTATPTARVDINEPTLGNKVFSRKSVATSDDPIDWERHGRVTTTDATTTVLTGCTETLTADNVYHIRGRIRARRTGGASGTANDGGTAEIVGSFVHRGGVAVQIGTTTTVHSQFDQAWTVTFTVSGNDVRVSVTGAASNNITWHGLLEVSQVST